MRGVCWFLLLTMTYTAMNSIAAEEPRIISVWPGQVPGESSLPAEFRDRVLQAEDRNTADRVFGVSIPQVVVYRAPAERANGAAVLICPGGGYNVLAWGHEGRDIAEWLNSIGVHAFILKYRVPRRPGDFALPPLQDAQRALRLIRAAADEYRIDPQRIGVLGFSAGGNLAVNVATRFGEVTYSPIDADDQLSARPNFAVPIYAAYLGSTDNDQRLSNKLAIDSQTPPVFLAVTQDDKNRGIHAAELFAELTRAGVSAEVHVYTKGGHGYGMRPGQNPVSEWPARCADWMNAMGLLSPSAAEEEPLDR